MQTVLVILQMVFAASQRLPGGYSVGDFVAASHSALPGGYSVGDFVVSKIDHKDADVRVKPGELGAVIGHASVDRFRRIAVKFPDAPHVNILPEQIKRAGVTIECTQKGRCYVKLGSGGSKPEGSGSDFQHRKKSTGQSEEATPGDQSWQIIKYMLIVSLLASLALGLRAVVEPFFERMEKERRAKKVRKEQERNAEVAMQWAVDADYQCAICEEPLLEPVTMACKHTVCQFCLQKWVSMSAGYGVFRCPVGGACPNVPRLVPSVNMQIRDAVELKFPDHLQARRETLAPEQAEFEKSLSTQHLQEEIDASYVQKRAINEEHVQTLLEAGANANVKSIKFSDDMLLKVILNSNHMTEDQMYTYAELLMNYGATLGELEMQALLPRWGNSQNRSKWEALGRQAGGMWDAAMTQELIGDFNVGDRVSSNVRFTCLNGTFLRHGMVGAVVGMGVTADRILVAFERGNALVNMLPTEVQPLSEEQASILQASAQRPADNHTMVHTTATAGAQAENHIRAFAQDGRLPEHLVRHFSMAFSIPEDDVRRICGGGNASILQASAQRPADNHTMVQEMVVEINGQPITTPWHRRVEEEEEEEE